MLKEHMFYDLSLLSYFPCTTTGICVADLIYEITHNEALREEYESMDDYRQNLLLLDNVALENYQTMYVRDIIDDNERSGVVYYVVETPDCIIFAFRGSEALDATHHRTGWQDWKDNFRMFLKEPTWQQLYALHQVQHSNLHKPFYLCGHSKGGNLALYIALTMKQEALDQLEGVISFNAPGITREIVSIYKQRSEDEAFLQKLTIFENEHDCVSAFFHNLKEPIYIKSQLPCTTLQQMYHNHNLYAMDFTNNAYVIAERKTAMPKLMYHFVNDFFVNLKEERLHKVIHRMDDYFDSGLSMEELYKVLLYHISQYTSLFEGIPAKEIAGITFQDLMERRKTKLLVQKVKELQPRETLEKVGDSVKETLNTLDIQEITQEIIRNYELVMEKTRDMQSRFVQNNERIITTIYNIRNRKSEE